MENSNRGLEGCYCDPENSYKRPEIPLEQEFKSPLDKQN